MIGYDVEEKKIEETIQQIYRDFALKYNEIKNSELSESEKQAQISELIDNTSNTEQILRNTRSLDEISIEDREALGIKEQSKPTKVDTNVIDTLVSIYAKRAKMPLRSIHSMGIYDGITLRENEEPESIDTSAFEEELRQYFTEHYYDLLSDGYNQFLSDATEVKDKDGIISEKNGKLTEMAIKHGLDPEKFQCFGYQLTIQDGLIAEEDSSLGRSNILYATPEAVNQRIFDIYSKILFREQQNKGKVLFASEVRKLKNTYITYAEKNGIQIENPDVLETLEVDMDKVQGVAKYINRVLNSKEGIEKGDYSQLFSDDIIKNYSKIMNLQWYDFGDLESVKSIAGKTSFFDNLHLKIEKDNISRTDELRPDIAYGTPEFVREEYKKIMQEVKRLHSTNAFQEKYFDVEKITAKKQAYRRYIQDNEIEGIDIAIPEVNIDHDRTEMIAEAIMQQYGKDYKDTENMKNKILEKLENNWSEIVTEAQVMDVKKLFGEELKEMGHQFPEEQLYVKEDFVYLGDYSGFTSNVIYATQEVLTENLAALDKKIASSNYNFDNKRIREGLVKYAEEQGFDMDIPSVESIENRGKQERENVFFNGIYSGIATEFVDPTAREKIELGDSVLDTVVKMSEGIPGAIEGLSDILKQDKDGFGIMLVLGLDDMNIRGSQIWEAYKYLYNENGKKFAEAIKNRDQKMVDFINQELAAVGEEKAVTGGASFDRSSNPDKYRFTELDVEELKVQREERLQKQREARDKMLANSPARKKSLGEKRREQREAKKKAYKEKLLARGKKSIEELDTELTDLQTKEQQAKELYDEYKAQLPDKTHEEL